MTDLEAIYRLASVVRDHLKASEDEKDPGVLPSDTVGGLLMELEQEADRRLKKYERR